MTKGYCVKMGIDIQGIIMMCTNLLHSSVGSTAIERSDLAIRFSYRLR
jgi:hypothetical protein